MRIPRIYTPQQLQIGSTIRLEEAASRHLGKVLRMTPGRELILFNAQGGEYSAIIHEVGKKVTQVTITEHNTDDRESPLHSHLAIGVSRGDRMDWVLQKACELGVSEITPLFTERTEVKLSGPRLEKKHQHWQQILISACEQCQRNRLPQLRSPLALGTFLSQPLDGEKWVLHHRDSEGLDPGKSVDKACILIGPEGGLSETEIDSAREAGFAPLTLGPRVMRTETAPLVALSLLQQYWGDF
ncbi:16S rRNA (uracil(1498)-N(3))-methyltransferase [Pseudoteredinibacter isoporae]|uniref:16S rRNA (uracil(1498)-N(3))-methyltransferase n=1 Tax=Pseudoteredinibacter isoporae TaxID=570281 RepID=UPI00310C7A8E